MQKGNLIEVTCYTEKYRSARSDEDIHLRPSLQQPGSVSNVSGHIPV